MMSGVEVWGVYHVMFNHKGKYFIALTRTLEEDVYGIKIPYWIGPCISSGKENDGDPSLHMCDVKIDANLNSNLDRLSYVNMGRLRKVAEQELSDFKRIIDRGTQNRIKEAAKQCRAVSPKLKDLICALDTRR